DQQIQFDASDENCVLKEGWAAYVQGTIREFPKCSAARVGFDAVIHGTIPLGSGLSSSASLETAVATLLEQMTGNELAALEKARLCQRAENEHVGVSCGILDQYSSIFGGDGAALLLDCRSLTHQPVSLPDDLSVVVVDTVVSRELAGSNYDLLREQCESAAEWFAGVDSSVETLRDVPLEMLERHGGGLPEEVRARARFIIEENLRVDAVAKAINGNDRTSIGELCAASFAGARDLFGICVPEMETMFSAMVLSKGCVGCRQTGGGFGGGMIAFVDTPQVAAFCEEVVSRYRQATGIEAKSIPVNPGQPSGLLPI
ncbi:MAG: galactokinase, partial [Planctomycetota bacterium]